MNDSTQKRVFDLPETTTLLTGSNELNKHVADNYKCYVIPLADIYKQMRVIWIDVAMAYVASSTSLGLCTMENSERFNIAIQNLCITKILKIANPRNVTTDSQQAFLHAGMIEHHMFALSSVVYTMMDQCFTGDVDTQIGTDLATRMSLEMENMLIHLMNVHMGEDFPTANNFVRVDALAATAKSDLCVTVMSLKA